MNSVLVRRAPEWGYRWVPPPPGALALVKGLVAIRCQGIYFAMITLALSQLLYFIFPQMPFPDGEGGNQGVVGGRMFGLLDLENQTTLLRRRRDIHRRLCSRPSRDQFAVRRGPEFDPRKRAARATAARDNRAFASPVCRMCLRILRYRFPAITLLPVLPTISVDVAQRHRPPKIRATLHLSPSYRQLCPRRTSSPHVSLCAERICVRRACRSLRRLGVGMKRTAFERVCTTAVRAPAPRTKSYVKSSYAKSCRSARSPGSADHA